jgi:opacity protein-like surface antigen
MRKLAMTILLCVAMTGVAAAQENNSGNSGATPNTRAGDKALMFSISGLGTFGITSSFVTSVPLSGTLLDSNDFMSFFEAFGVRIGRPLLGLGFKTFLGDDLALRGGLSLMASSKTTPTSDTTESKSSSFGFGISPALEIHLGNAGPVSGYTGVVLSFGTFTKVNQPRDTVEDFNSATTFGGGAILGVEYTPWSNISLGAEYQLGVTATSVKEDVNGRERDLASTTDIGIGAFAVMLNVYF